MRVSQKTPPEARLAMPPPRRSLTVILKATDMCNAACTFCSIGPSGKERMAWEDFERLAEELERTARIWALSRLELTFHGGEPTLLGAEWIDRACRRLSGIDAQVAFSMQSNLLTFADDMVEVARRHAIRVGSSIDPLFRQRRLAGGGDGYPRWVRNYERLCREGFSVGAIFVVTREAAGRAADLYDCCEQLNALTEHPFGLQINPVYAQGRAAANQEVLLSAAEYGRFLVDVHRRWEDAGRSVNVGPIREMVEAFEQPGRHPSLSCSFGGNCATTHVGVDWDLNVAGCGRRLDSGALLGNLRDAHLDELVRSSEEMAHIDRRSKLLRAGDCADCRFFWVCRGGCPDAADLASGSVTDRSPWCEAYTMLFEEIERRTAARPRPRARRTTLRVGVEPGALQGGPIAGEVVERWMWPTDEGRALRFDSGLGSALYGPSDLLRIRVHNRHASALTMWQDLVRDVRVTVELFEAEGLETALNVLNALGATVRLDLPRIAASPEGPGALAAALERYLTDPLCRIQVRPFADMLQNAVEGRRSESTNVWGLPPGTFDVVWPEGDALGDDETACEQLRADVDRDLAAWQAQHLGCRDCPHLAICGGRLVTGGESPCGPTLRELVDRIAGLAATIGRQLEEAAREGQ